MNNVFTIEDSAANKISFYHLAAFLALLPFDYFYSQLVLISFGLHTLIHLKKDRLSLLLAKETWLPAVVYLMLLASVLYSTDKQEGLDISGRQSAMIILPVLLALSNLNLAKHRLKLLNVFAASCVLVVLYLYADAFYTLHYFHLPYKDLFSTVFTNHNFSEPVGLHATYLSMYLALSVACLLYNISVSRSSKEKTFLTVATIILIAGLIQLTSRAAVTGLLIIIASAVYFIALPAKRKRLFFFTAVFFTAAAVLFILQSSTFRQRYISELKNDLTNQPVADEALEPRILRWEQAVSVIKKSPLYGYGNGSEKKLLKEKYFENKLYISFLKSFNAHSQYLSFLLRCGVPGLLLFLSVMGMALYIAVKRKDFLFFSFVALIASVSVSENILDVNKGIFFYSFFLSLFLISNNPEIFYKATEKS